MDVETGVGNQLAHLVHSLAGASMHLESVSVTCSRTNFSRNWSSAVPLTSWDMSMDMFEAAVSLLSDFQLLIKMS